MLPGYTKHKNKTINKNKKRTKTKTKQRKQKRIRGGFSEKVLSFERYTYSQSLRLTVNISSRQRPMSNLLRSLVLTSNQPTCNICLHSNQIGYHIFGLPRPRLEPPSPDSITWNCTTGICQAQVACCCTDTLVHWDSSQEDWPGSVFLDSVSVPGWISNKYLRYANFQWPSKIEFGPKIDPFLKPGLN